MSDTLVRRNPAHPGEVVGSVVVTAPAGVTAAVAAAAAAQPAWAALDVEDRAARLRAAVAALEPQTDELALLLARELGKPLADSRGEIAFAWMLARWMAGEAPALLAPQETDDDRGRLLLERRPYGVVAALTPWNAPVILAMLKVAPALLAGNTAVVKPSPLVPLTVGRVLTALGAALPHGVLQGVHGDAATGTALVGDPRVGRVSFTGGGATARTIAGTVAATLTPLLLELGGNDPAVLLDDVVLDDAAVERLLVAAFATSGQVCMALKRLYVHRTRRDELVERLRTVAERTLVVGDPLRPGVTVGPLVTAAAVARVAALLDDARARGGEVMPLGRVDDEATLREGWFLRPTLTVGVDESAPLVATEQFGPALPLLTFDDEDDVVHRANAGELGLGASAWSGDEERAMAFARRLDAGFRFVNTHNRGGMTLRAPFGGVRRSGHGREYGHEGILEYTQVCPVHLPAAVRAGGAAVAASAYPAG